MRKADQVRAMLLNDWYSPREMANALEMTDKAITSYIGMLREEGYEITKRKKFKNLPVYQYKIVCKQGKGESGREQGA